MISRRIYHGYESGFEESSLRATCRRRIRPLVADQPRGEQRPCDNQRQGAGRRFGRCIDPSGVVVTSDNDKASFQFRKKIWKDGDLPTHVTCKRPSSFDHEGWDFKRKINDLVAGKRYPLHDVLTARRGGKRYVVTNEQQDVEDYPVSHFEENL